MDNPGTINVPVISTNLKVLTLYIQTCFRKMTREEQCVREVRFYLIARSVNQDGIHANIDYFMAELRNMMFPDSTKYLLVYRHADNFDAIVLDEPCGYDEILSFTKECCEKFCEGEILDLENIYTDESSIEDLILPDETAQATQDDSQELMLIPCKDCKHAHTKCENPSSLFYRMPCEIVQKCEQGEEC